MGREPLWKGSLTDNVKMSLLLIFVGIFIHVVASLILGMAAGQSIILGALSDADLAGNFESGSSVDFSPFIVNSNETIDMTERLLQKRLVMFWLSHHFLCP